MTAVSPTLQYYTALGGRHPPQVSHSGFLFLFCWFLREYLSTARRCDEVRRGAGETPCSRHNGNHIHDQVSCIFKTSRRRESLQWRLRTTLTKSADYVRRGGGKPFKFSHERKIHPRPHGWRRLSGFVSGLWRVGWGKNTELATDTVKKTTPRQPFIL